MEALLGFGGLVVAFILSKEDAEFLEPLKLFVVQLECELHYGVCNLPCRLYLGVLCALCASPLFFV